MGLAEYEGDWAFQKLAQNKVKVSTYGYAIPLSFVNMLVQQQPYQTLQKNEIRIRKTSQYFVLARHFTLSL